MFSLFSVTVCNWSVIFSSEPLGKESFGGQHVDHSWLLVVQGSSWSMKSVLGHVHSIPTDQRSPSPETDSRMLLDE